MLLDKTRNANQSNQAGIFNFFSSRCETHAHTPIHTPTDPHQKRYIVFPPEENSVDEATTQKLSDQVQKLKQKEGEE